jgi:hypothetical protein
LTSIPGLGIDADTKFRIVAITNMNPAPSMGNNAQSDVGGVTEGTSLDKIYTKLIEPQTPTSTNNINDGGILDRSDCPSINPVGATDGTITGSSTEASGTTIKVSVYESNGTTKIGSGTTTTSGADWSINVSSLSPSVTLAAGQIVKATAQASGEGESYDNCNPVTVTDCSQITATPTATQVKKISGSKGYDLVMNGFPQGTQVYLYKQDYTLRGVGDLKYSVTNPYTTTSNNQTFSFECQTGNCFGTDVYMFRFKEPNKCISDYYVSCDYGGTPSATPTITNISITPDTTVIRGRGTATGSTIYIYSNGVKIGTATSGSSPYNYYATVSGLTLGQVITAKQIVSGSCLSSATAGVTVTRPAFKPVINFSGCAIGTVTSLSGFSAEAAGSTIMLYRVDGTRTELGSTTVAADGTWTKTGLSLTSTNQVVAAVTAGTNLTVSPDSDPVTISTQTNISNYTIGFTQPTEGETAVSGTISGGSYSVTLKVYVDEVLVGSGVSVDYAGNWSVTGLNSFDLAVGSKVQATVTATGSCESVLSSTYTTVKCESPVNKAISASETTLCSGSYGSITIENAEADVIYTPILASDNSTFGFSGMGDGGNLVITTNALNANTTVKVKASKFPLGTCDLILTGSIAFTVNPLPAAPTVNTSTQSFCVLGMIADLAATAPNGSTVRWYAASTGGSPLVGTTALTNNTTYYAESYNETTGCVSSSRTALTVQQGTPTAPTANANQTFCPSTTVASLNAIAPSGYSVEWYAAASGGSPLASNTVLGDHVDYYAQSTSGACVSTSRTQVTAHIDAIAAPTADATQTFCNSATVADLEATALEGYSVEWYAASSGGSALSNAASLVNNTKYYAQATSGACTSVSRTEVTAQIIVPAAPTADDTQTFCGSATVADLAATVADGYSLQWFAASSGGTALFTSSALVNGTTYYAGSLSAGNCASVTRTAVAVQIGTPQTPTASATQNFSPGATVADLAASVSEGTIYWFAASSGGEALASNTLLVNGATYYAGTVEYGCNSTRDDVTVVLAWSVTVSSSNGNISKSVPGTASGTPNMSYYSNGTSVTFTGTPSAEYVLTGWKVNGSTVASNPDGTLTLTVDGDKTVEAIFTKIIVYRSSANGYWTTSNSFISSIDKSS